MFGLKDGTLGTSSRIWRALLACSVCAAGLWIAFIALLGLGLVLSSDARITATLNEALARGVLTRESYPVSPFGNRGHDNDLYTECAAFGLNLNIADKGLLYRMAASPWVTDPAPASAPGGACEVLVGALERGEARADEQYLRFWHGYQVLTRPALSVLSLQNFRKLVGVMFYGALIFFAARMAKIFGPWAWPVSLLPFFLIGDFFTVPIVTIHAISLTWIFLSVALTPIVLGRSTNSHDWMLPAFVFSAGAVTNYVSYLFNPPLAPALIGFIVIAMAGNKTAHETRASLLHAGALVFLWFAGYGAAWIEKWLFALAVLGPDPVAAELLGRLDHYADLGGKEHLGFLSASWRNLSINGLFLACILGMVALTAALVGWLLSTNRIALARFWDFLAMQAPLMAIILWVELNAAHSAQHNGYVSRSFLLFAIVPLLAALLTWQRARAPGSN